MGSIHIRNVSKSFPIHVQPGDRLRDLFTGNARARRRDFRALRDVSLEIPKGATFGLIGENGSGKSTLLQLIAGILKPTGGEVVVEGRVSALLELGSGFNPEYTGRENVFLYGAILGLSHREMERLYPAIESFAEIGDFIDRPVKTYSSGMAIRLAFAAAVSVAPDILLVDEALAVGDIYFRQRCMRKMHELKRAGVTIVFVTHAAGDVKTLADGVAWLERGRLIESGDPEPIVARYLAAMVRKDSAYRKRLPREGETDVEAAAPVRAPEIVRRIPNIDYRYGNRAAEILGVAVLGEEGEELPLLPQKGRIIVRISLEVRAEVPMPIVGFLMRNHLGVDLAGTNTALEETDLPPFRPGDVHTFDFHLQLPELYPSQFSFTPAVASGTVEDYEVCDLIENAVALEAERGRLVYGYLHFPCEVRINSVTASRVRVSEPGA